MPEPPCGGRSGGEPLILVYQMAKVASQAWVEAARPAARRGGEEPLHAHYLTAGHLRALEALLKTDGDAGAIARPLIVRDIIRKGRALTAVERARDERRPIQVITGMREPVARSISLVSFLADFVGHTGGNLSARDGASAETVCRFLHRLWADVLSGTEPAGGFERLAWRMTGAYRTWFQEELAAVFGLDVFASPFPTVDGARRMRGAGVELLAYRAEDMAAESPNHSALLAAARSFLGAPDLGLPQINTAATRRSHALYQETRARFRLSAAVLDRVYGAPAVAYFYSPDEIAKFKQRWCLV